jgi:hypothetical protein
MPTKHQLYFSNKGTRNEVRMRVVSAFSSEEPGNGSGEAASKHIYEVEHLSDGDKVLLVRPSRLHNGFDFLITLEKMSFKEKGNNRNAPKFDDLFADLRLKKENNLERFQNLVQLLERVFLCEYVSDEEINALGECEGWTIEMVLKVSKWFFIEQDIRYWNYSGRLKLWNGIKNI